MLVSQGIVSSSEPHRLSSLILCLSADADARNMGLERSQSLRSLFIQPGYATSGLSSNNRDRQAVYDWVGIKAILQLGLYRVRHLSIQLYEHPLTLTHIIQCLDLIEWLWLEDCHLDNYPMLKTVTFHYVCGYDALQHAADAETIRSYIREHLPRLHEKNLVRLSGTVSCLNEIDRIVCTDPFILSIQLMTVSRLFVAGSETDVKIRPSLRKKFVRSLGVSSNHPNVQSSSKVLNKIPFRGPT